MAVEAIRERCGHVGAIIKKQPLIFVDMPFLAGLLGRRCVTMAMLSYRRGLDVTKAEQRNRVV